MIISVIKFLKESGLMIINEFFKYCKRRTFSIIFKIILAFILMYIGSIILFIPRAHAQVVSSGISVNGYEATTRNFISVPNSQWAYMIIDATNTTNSGYFKISSCYDGVITQYGIDYPTIFSNPLVVQTKVPCKYYNSSYDKGTVTNFYFNYNVSSSGATSFSTTFSFLTFAATFQLLSVESSDVPFDVTSGLSDDSNYKIIDQNQTVIDQNNQIINGNKVLSEKQDQTNQELKDLNDSLKDDSIDSEKSSGFFGNFSTTDNGGLSGIIKSPLVAINKMTQGTCTPLTASFKGKDISLPCGTEFWSSISEIKQFLNVVIGGLICYGILVKMYRLIERIKNPEDDRVEVMKL